MGASSTTYDNVAARVAYRAASGTSYAYTTSMASTPVRDRKVDDLLDPKKLNTFNKRIRECLDSETHTETLPVAVFFDETGSMGEVPRILQTKLAGLKGATLKVGLVDAQLLFGAYGDAQNGEVAPLQVGQFESGLEFEDILNNIYLEGNGGGNDGETGGFPLWFLGTHSRLDSVEKRDHKGYLFLVGDERPLPYVTKAEIKRYVDEDVEADISVKVAAAMAQQYYNVIMFLIDNSTAKYQKSFEAWSKVLGTENVVRVQDPATIAEQISLWLARAEGLIDSFDDGIDLLTDSGFSHDDAAKAVKDLAVYDTTIGAGMVATATGDLPEASEDAIPSGSTRL